MIKKAVVWVVALFAVYSVVATPQTAAGAVLHAGEFVQEMGGQVLEFLEALVP